MLLYLLLSIYTLYVPFYTERVVLDVLDQDIEVQYEYRIPSKSYNLAILLGTDVGGSGKTYIYTFESGACLYLSNEGSLCPALSDNESITGDVIQRTIRDDLITSEGLMINEGEKYYVEREGFTEESGYYRDWESFDVCIGYYGVRKEEKLSFDTAINSLRAIKARSWDKKEWPRIGGKAIITPH